MHELSIARSIVEVVTGRIVREQPGFVSSVTLHIGDVSGVDVGLLEYAFPVAAEGTPLEDSALIIERKPVSFRCRACGNDGIEMGIVRCPSCGSNDIELTTGMELEIVSFELLEPDGDPV